MSQTIEELNALKIGLLASVSTLSKAITNVEEQMKVLSSETDSEDYDPGWKQGPQQKLTASGRKKIVELFEAGATDADVEAVMGISASAISRNRNKWEAGRLSPEPTTAETVRDVIAVMKPQGRSKGDVTRHVQQMLEISPSLAAMYVDKNWDRIYAYGNRGSWFAAYGGDSYPCVHKYWVTPDGRFYDDRGLRLDNKKAPEFVAGIKEKGRVLITDDLVTLGDDGMPARFDRNGYIGFRRVADVEFDEKGLRFRFVD